jgi:hypothetical protein
MKVIIELPEASQFDAEAFGLWIKMVLDNKTQDGDLDTKVGDIRVAP